MAATARMKEGLPCDLLDRLAADAASFGLDRAELEALMEPSRYIGRCPEQVERYAGHCLEVARQAGAARAEDIDL